MIALRRPTGPMGVERRSHPRLAPEELAEPVSVVGSRLLNIGRGGLMLEAPIPLAPESTGRGKSDTPAAEAENSPAAVAPASRWA